MIAGILALVIRIGTAVGRWATHTTANTNITKKLVAINVSIVASTTRCPTMLRYR